VLLVVGKREAEEKTVSVRRLGSQQQQVVPLAEVVKTLAEEAVPPDRKGSSSAVGTAA
jgi:threonyl-tRNA synthetase